MASKGLLDVVQPKTVAGGKTFLYANRGGRLLPLLPNTNNLHATLSIHINNFQPSLSVTVRKSNDETDAQVESSASMNFDSTVDTDHIVEEQSEYIRLSFAYGCKLNVWQQDKVENTTQTSDLCLTKTSNNVPESVRGFTDPERVDVSEMDFNVIEVNIGLKGPTWAEQIKAYLRSEDAVVTAFFDGSFEKLEALKALQKIFNSSLDPVLRFHRNVIHTDKPVTNFTQSSRDGSVFNARPLRREYIGYEAACSFRHPREYMTAMMAGATLDEAENCAKQKAYESKTKTLILVPGPRRNGNRCFWGFIDGPKWGECRLRTDDSMEIEFDTPGTVCAVPSWQGVVIDHHKIHCRGKLPLLVVPSSLDPGKPRLFSPRVLTRDTSDANTINNALRNEKGNAVQVTINVNELTFKRIGLAYQSLYDAVLGSPRRDRAFAGEGSDARTYHTRMVQIMCGQRPDQWVAMDLYGTIKDHELPKTVARPECNLNDSQMQAVSAARNIRGGVQLIQGPPGTGKTYLIACLCQPFFVAEDKVTVLVVAPTNRGADDLAHDLGRALNVSKFRGDLHAKGRYILRIHVESSEEAIFNTQSGIDNIPGQTNGENDIDGSYKYAGVHDKRIQDIRYSIGYMMLLVSGIVQDGEYNDPDETKYASFRRVYQKLHNREPLSATERRDYYQTKTQLRNRIIQEASGVVGTTTGVLASYVMKHIQSRVGAVFMDEAAYEREDHLAPIFAAEFQRNPCFVVVGDHQQLRPLVKSQEVNNAFKPQLEMSFMARMIGIGLEYNMLTEQHRMVPDIAKIPNMLTYKGKLTNAAITEPSKRETAQKFRTFTKTKFNKSCNALLYYLPRSEDNIGRRKNGDRSGGKANQFYVCVVAKLLPDLIENVGTEASIAILTPYLFQKSFYSKMVSSMRRRNVPGVENITVETFDAAQGREFDIVIVDLPMDHSIGFLSDRNRLNVAMTRARDGFIILCDRDHILRSTQDAGYLQDLVRLLKDSTFEAPRQDNYPTTPYFEPTEY